MSHPDSTTNPSSLSELARRRHTCKGYDTTKTVAPAAIDELLTLLRYSPSSVNSQPWHFVLAASTTGKARIAQCLEGAFAYNVSKVRDASHVLVLCARTDITSQHLEALLDQEQIDGRFRDADARAAQHKSRSSYVALHRHDQKDLPHWVEKQVYLSLGTLLLGAVSLGLDATPMEGFDPKTIDAELDLRAQGFTSVVLVALGYRGTGDFNARLPKSRLPEATVVTRI